MMDHAVTVKLNLIQLTVQRNINIIRSAIQPVNLNIVMDWMVNNANVDPPVLRATLGRRVRLDLRVQPVRRATLGRRVRLD